MTDIGKRLVGALVENSEEKRFIPEREVDEILTPDVVTQCIQNSSIDSHWRKDCVDAVNIDGRKTLAILIMIEKESFLPKFVEKYWVQKSIYLDEQLPFKLEHLNNLLGDKMVTSNFYDKQWTVKIPFFSDNRSHQIHDMKAFLPSVGRKEALSEGAFGEVFIVNIAAGQHGFQGLPNNQGQVRVVRKTLKPPGNNDSTNIESQFKNEDQILSLLRSLRHPNIVRLLASYTLDGGYGIQEHNFLFPLADATLSKMLKSNEHNTWSHHFPSEHILFRQLYGLSSAIQSLHKYIPLDSVDSDGLELIGCHNDISPRNVLVHNGALLLADFGLSRVHPENSKTTFKFGQGDYMAPECEPIEGDSIGMGVISRPNDIWSFGCVVLNILTNHNGRSEAVERFQRLRRANGLRKFTWGSYRAPKFHCFDRLNPGVTEWLRDPDWSPRSTELLPLIRDMLQIEPTSRPTANIVTKRMFLHAEKMVYETILLILDTIIKGSSSIELKIEQERFVLWGWGAKMLRQERNTILTLSK